MIVYKGRMLKNLKIENQSSMARPINAGHYMAFENHISFARLG